jgi:hypothetical protein
MTGSELVQSTPITALWTMLGGGEVRRGRSRAFWRAGDGWSVALDDAKRAWFDHRAGIGGGVVDLIVRARGGTRSGALRWLADATGQNLDGATQTPSQAGRQDPEIRQNVAYFANAAAVMAEDALAAVDCFDPSRATYTSILRELRAAPEAVYHKWLDCDEPLTKALVHAGRQREHRLNRLLAGWLAKAEHAA